MVSEPILARLLGLSGHLLSGRHWTTLTYKFCWYLVKWCS